MTSHVFRWPHEATEVYVTGTFDNWAKTEKLTKVGRGFEGTVRLPSVDSKIFYKFVVDGHWTTDHTAPSERDHDGNVNNILTPDHFQSAAAPASSSAATASAVSHHTETTTGSKSLPGVFPVTPLETPAGEQTFSVNPLPATSGASNPVSLAPGEKVPHSSEYSSSNVNSNVKLDKESYEKGNNTAEQTFAVNPIPATAGAGNPIKLAPGKKVPAPSTYTTGDLTSNVRLDKESYEKSGSGVPQLPPVLNKTEEAEAAGAPIFGLGPATGNIIPESSLPMGNTGVDVTNPFVSSVAPQSTTAQLAGQQPVQSRVPEVVKESQDAGFYAHEATDNKEAVREKSAVESELLQKVPTEPATSESGLTGKSEKGYLGTAAATATAAGVAATGAAVAAKDQVFGQQSAGGATTAQLAGQQPIEPRTGTVPEIVKESQATAHAAPEASASTEAVREKSAVEQELLKKVPTESATSESGMLGASEKGYLGTAAAAVAGAGAVAAGAAYAAKNQVFGQQSAGGSTTAQLGGQQPIVSRGGVPEVVKESQTAAHADPEASASKEAVREKSAVEAELLKKVPTESATSESGAFGKSEKGTLGGAAAAATAAGAALTGGALAAKDKVVGPTSSTSTSNGVPAIVTESQSQAHAAPEAAANPEAVREKSAVERELEQKVHHSQSTGEPAPTASAALTSTAPSTTAAAPTSTTDATTSSSAAAEFGDKVDAAFDSGATGRSLTPGRAGSIDRDVSPMSRPGEPSAAPKRTTQPTTPQKSENRKSLFGSSSKKHPESGSGATKGHDVGGSPVTSTATAGTASDAEKKANKRRSFFGKIKEKLKN